MDADEWFYEKCFLAKIEFQNKPLVAKRVVWFFNSVDICSFVVVPLPSDGDTETRNASSEMGHQIIISIFLTIHFITDKNVLKTIFEILAYHDHLLFGQTSMFSQSSIPKLYRFHPNMFWVGRQGNTHPRSNAVHNNMFYTSNASVLLLSLRLECTRR